MKMSESEQRSKNEPRQPTVAPRLNPPIDEERLKQAQQALAEVCGH
jgi:hypothetical protein